MELDEKNCEILNLLQVNSRSSLTEISKHVDLSIDSVNKRINRMLDSKIFWPKIQLRPRNFGFKNIVDVKIKLNYSSEKDMSEFTNYLKRHPRVIEIFSISGGWDFSIVIMAKDAIELGKISREIRSRFGRIITEWNENLTTESFKFEYYDMCQIMGHPPTKVKFDY